MNPILPPYYCIPDVEAHQWKKNGRLFLYGSWDINGDTFYCSSKYHVFSTDNLENWVDHGESFNLKDCHLPEMEWLYAPDCFYKDNKYYLLYNGHWQAEGIAESSVPEGPFVNARPIANTDRDGIDPAAFVDDDGSVYYFWGQFQLRGAKLNDNLCSLDKNTFNPSILTEKNDGFHEGSSLRKRNGIYYLVYTDISRGRATSLGYAMSKLPLGPYKKMGIIIDNNGCDPETWNNHGSIEMFNDQWYVFYHRSSQGSQYNRRVCMEPIYFNEDGMIDEVEMTTQGISGPLNARNRTEAWRACLLHGKVHSEVLHRTTPEDPHVECLTSIHNGNWAAYKYLDFGTGITKFRATVGSIVGGGKIAVRIGEPRGVMIAELEIPETGGWKFWQEVETQLKFPISGVHAVYIWFWGRSLGRICDFLDFSFT